MGRKPEYVRLQLGKDRHFSFRTADLGFWLEHRWKEKINLYLTDKQTNVELDFDTIDHFDRAVETLIHYLDPYTLGTEIEDDE